MNISKYCKLYLKDIYYYDISSCHYELLKRMGVSISHINKDDKIQRNVQIGLMMRDSKIISDFLRDTTNSIMDEYIRLNDLQPTEIITRQYDGIITTRILRNILDYVPLDLRHVFCSFIISSRRNMYIALDRQDVVHIKGVPNQYDEMNKLYERIVKINYLSKDAIFSSLESIKREIMTSDNNRLYCIPLENGKYNLFVKEMGSVIISDSLINMLDLDDVDRKKYFDFYIRPFSESIVINFLKEEKI